MDRLEIVIRRIDDQHPHHCTELAVFPLPRPDVTTLAPETALDDLEATSYEADHALLSVATQKSPLVATVVLPARGCRSQATTPWKRILSLAVCGLSVGACLVSASREWGSSTGHWWGL